MKRLLLGSLLVFLVFGAGYALLNRGADSSLPVVQRLLTTSFLHHSTVNPEQLAVVFADGEIRSYQFEQRSTVTMDGSSGNKSEILMTTSGILVQEMLEKTKGRFVIVMRIEQPRLVFAAGAGQVSTEKTDQVSAEVKRGLVVEMDATGKVLGIRGELGVSPESIAIFRSLLDVMNVVPPNTSSAERWNAESEDTTGRYHASYEVIGYDEKHVRIVRKKESYLTLRGASLNGDTPLAGLKIEIEPNSETTFTYDFSLGMLFAAKQIERVRTISPGIGFDSLLETTINWQSREVRSSQELKERLDAFRQLKLESEDAIDGREVRSITQKVAVQKLAGKTLNQLLNDFDTISWSGSDGSSRFRLLEQLTAWLTLHPDDAALVFDVIAKLKAEDPFRQEKIAVWFGALSALESEAAEKTLVNFVENSLDDRQIEMQALAALANFKKPSELSVRALFSIYESPANREQFSSATLALGAIAKNIAPYNIDSSKQITQKLVRQFQDADNGSARMTALGGLGNSGATDALEPIKQALNDESVDMQSAALFELRFLPAGEADVLLDTVALDTKRAASVASSAVATLRFRAATPENLKVAAEVFRLRKEEPVRLEALRTVVHIGRSLPDPARIILEQAAKDPSENIRNAAEKHLAVL